MKQHVYAIILSCQVKEAIPKAYVLYDSIYITLWKGQNNRDNTSVVVRDWEKGHCQLQRNMRN